MVFKRYHAVLIMLRIVIRVCISINLILYICIACNMVVQDGINSIFHNIWQALFVHANLFYMRVSDVCDIH